MKRVALIATLLVLTAGGWIFLYHQKHSYHFGRWTSSADIGSSMVWIPFTWEGDSIGNSYYDKLAIFVPVSIEGVAGQFQCQFDNGSNITMLYENPLNSISGRFPHFREKLRQQISGKDTVRYIKDLHLSIGGIHFQSPEVAVFRNYGEELPADAPLPVGHKIGTVGVDICKDRILVIDYPHNRLCVTKHLDMQYNVSWTPMTLDESGRVVLPLEYKGKHYKVLFDCGSSMFPLLASHRILSELTQAAANDTVAVSSWGNMLQVVGRPMSDSFALAGNRFGGINVYSNNGSEEIVPKEFDAITGNALFLDKVVVIDFKNKRFGIAR